MGQRQLLQWCYEHDRLLEAEQCWKCCLLPLGTVCRPRGSSTWLLSLGDLGAVLVLGWTLDLREGKAGLVLELRHTGDPNNCLEHLLCLDWDEWEVPPTTPVSPVHMQVLCKKGLPGAAPGLAYLATDEPTSVLSAAALACFVGLSMTMVKRVMRAEGLAVPRGQTDLACLTALLAHCLPSATPAEITALLAKRATKPRDKLPPGVSREALLEAMEGADEARDFKEGCC